jgi:hypothetical protein
MYLYIYIILYIFFIFIYIQVKIKLFALKFQSSLHSVYTSECDITEKRSLNSFMAKVIAARCQNIGFEICFSVRCINIGRGIKAWLT